MEVLPDVEDATLYTSMGMETMHNPIRHSTMEAATQMRHSHM